MHRASGRPVVPRAELHKAASRDRAREALPVAHRYLALGSVAALRQRRRQPHAHLVRVRVRARARARVRVRVG